MLDQDLIYTLENSMACNYLILFFHNTLIKKNIIFFSRSYTDATCNILKSNSFCLTHSKDILSDFWLNKYHYVILSLVYLKEELDVLQVCRA